MGHFVAIVIDDDPDAAMYPFADYVNETDGHGTSDVKFDYYGIATDHQVLRLSHPKHPPFLDRLFGARCKEFVSQARKREIDVDGSKLDAVAAVLVNGKWHSCPWIADESPDMKKWDAEVVRRVKVAPNNVLVTIMDCHL